MFSFPDLEGMEETACLHALHICCVRPAVSQFYRSEKKGSGLTIRRLTEGKGKERSDMRGQLTV